MKLFLLLLLMPICAFAGVNPFVYRLDTSSVNLTSSFPTDPQIGVTVAGPANGISTVDINNPTASELEINCSATSVPSSNAQGGFYVPAGTPFHRYNASLPWGKKCWMRTVTGTASVGIILLQVEGF